MRNMWIEACEAWPLSEQFFVVATASVVHGIVLWASCAFFCVLDKADICAQFKLPRERACMSRIDSRNVNLDSRALNEQLLGTFVVVPVAVYFLYFALAWRGIMVCPREGIDFEFPTAMVMTLDLVKLIIGCDFLFYWVHRALHANKWLYRNIHKQHHEYVATNAWGSEYFSPVDMILNIIPGVAPALVLGTHFASILLFTSLRQWQTVSLLL
jgi:sterol desaturase/sphingolipid hydroxylase (fatty acid hydroxylase superfamily)